MASLAKQKPPRTAEIPRLCREAEFIPASARDEDRSIDVVWTTGAEVRRFDWWTGNVFLESLSMKPEHVDLRRLNSGAPVLFDHSAWRQIGKVIEGSARIEDGVGVARLRFSMREEVSPIWQDIRDGIRPKFSVGYDVLTYDEEFKDGKLFRRTAILWEPAELSSVSMPADIGAGVRDHAPKNPCTFIRSQSSPPPQKRGTMKPKLKTRMTSEEKITVITEILGDASYDLATEEGKKAAAMAIVLKLSEEPAPSSEEPVEEGMSEVVEAARAVTGLKDPKAVVGALRALAQAPDQVKQLSERLAALEGERLAARVDKAIEQGLLTPAQREWALSIGERGLEGFLKIAVPLGPGQRSALPPSPVTPSPTPTADAPDKQVEALCQRADFLAHCRKIGQAPKEYAEAYVTRYPSVPWQADPPR